LGPKAGPRLQAVKAAVESMPATELLAGTRGGKTLEVTAGGAPLPLEAADFTVGYRAAVGWAGVADSEVQVALDTRVTEALAAEGMAREVVRHVQDTRKKADLQMEDRIELHLDTASDRLRQAIDAHKDYIAGETLATKWATAPVNGESHQANVNVDGQPLTIALR